MMTPELREYKTQTYNQLDVTLPHLEAQLMQTTDSAVARRISKQIEAIRLHMQRLHYELATDMEGEPIASDLFQKAARAVVKQKLHMAQKAIFELETIEPFYPSLNRLKQEIETGKISRNTRSIAEGTAPAFRLTASRLSTTQHVAASGSGGMVVTLPPPVAGGLTSIATQQEQPTPRGGWRNLFQFHIVVSLLLICFLFCSMAAIGGTVLLEYLIEGL